MPARVAGRRMGRHDRRGPPRARRPVKRGRRASRCGTRALRSSERVCRYAILMRCSGSSEGRPADPDQGRLAPTRPASTTPTSSATTRPRPRRDPPDGRDQRGLRGAPRGTGPARGATGDEPDDAADDGERRRPRRDAARRSASAAPDPPGHRPGRHDRHLPGPQPARTTPRGTAAPTPGRPAAAAPCRATSASRPAPHDPTGPLAPVADPQFQPPDPPDSRGRVDDRARRSASSAATRSARSPDSSRPTSTGSRRRSPATRDLVAAARVDPRRPRRRGIVRRLRETERQQRDRAPAAGVARISADETGEPAGADRRHGVRPAAGRDDPRNARSPSIPRGDRRRYQERLSPAVTRPGPAGR